MYSFGGSSRPARIVNLVEGFEINSYEYQNMKPDTEPLNSLSGNTVSYLFVSIDGVHSFDPSLRSVTAAPHQSGRFASSKSCIRDFSFFAFHTHLEILLKILRNVSIFELSKLLNK